MPVYSATKKKRSTSFKLSNLTTDILNGSCKKDCITSITPDSFTAFLNQILFKTSNCDQSKNDSFISALTCVSSEKRNGIIHSYLHGMLKKNQLANLLTFFADYIRIKKEVLSQANIKDLFFLIAHFNVLYASEINNTQRALKATDLHTFSSFLYFFNHLLRLPTIKQLDTPQLIHFKNDTIFFQTITFGAEKPIEFFIGHSNQLLNELILKFDPNQYVIPENAVLFLIEQLGKLGFKINKAFPSLSGITDKSIHEIFTRQLIQNESLPSAGWIYLNDYYQGNMQAIKDGCANLGLVHCHPPKTQLFQNIISGKNISNFSLGTFEAAQAEIFWSARCDAFKNKEKVSIFNFLTNILKENSLEKLGLKSLLTFVSSHIQQFIKRINKTSPDKNLSEAIENLSSLLFNIIKHTKKNDFDDQIHVMRNFADLFKMIDQTSPLKNSLNTIAGHLFSMLARCIDSGSTVETNYTDLMDTLKTISSVCKQNKTTCNLKKTAALSFKILGAIYRKSLSTATQTTTKYALETIKEANQLVKSFEDDLDPQQLKNAVSFFFKPGIKQSLLNKQCKQLFRLEGCRPARLINLALQIENKMENKTISPILNLENPTTLKSEIHLPYNNANSTLPLATLPTTLSPVSPQQNATALTEFSQQADTTSPMPTAVEFSASAAHGVLSGALNSITQYFAEKYTHTNERRLARTTRLLYSSPLGQASLAATFPLMLNEIQKQLNQGHEEDSAELSTLLLEQSLPIFISSLVVNYGLQVIREFTHLFDNRWVRYLGGNILPFTPAVISAYKNPLPTATQIGTSMATSSLIYGLFNRVAPVKQTSHKNDVETNAIEMKPLNTEKTMSTAHKSLLLKDEKHQYITEEKFTTIKNNSKKILSELSEINSFLDKSIKKMRLKIEFDTPPALEKLYQEIIENQSAVLELIQKTQEACRQEVSLLEDDHSDAYQKYWVSKSETEKEIVAKYTGAMERLGNVFKRMVTLFHNMELNLKSVETRIACESNSFSDSDFIQNKIQDIIKNIEFIRSDVKNYVNLYCTDAAGRKGKKEGILEGRRQQALETLHLEHSLNPRRSKKTRAYFDNRSQSMISDTKTLSSASDESSVISTAGSSKDNEEIQIIRPLLQSSF